MDADKDGKISSRDLMEIFNKDTFEFIKQSYNKREFKWKNYFTYKKKLYQYYLYLILIKLKIVKCIFFLLLTQLENEKKKIF